MPIGLIFLDAQTFLWDVKRNIHISLMYDAIGTAGPTDRVGRAATSLILLAETGEELFKYLIRSSTR